MRKTKSFSFLSRILALACLLIVFSGSELTQAQDGGGEPAEAASISIDDGLNEIGVEWITDWPGTADDRANWYYSANDLYNKLRNAGWTGRFNYGNTNAWEKDFKHSMYGGINDTVIDAVDLAMMATHGSSEWDSRYSRWLSSVYFSSNNHDWHLSPGEAWRTFGNTDLEWLAFDSCSVLRDDSMYYWHETFDRLHLMLGFANTMYVVYRGDGGAWADELLKTGWWIFGHPAKTVTQAWFSATDDEQPNGVRARVLAEELNSYNDYIHGQGYVSPDYPNDGDYWYWDHVAGTPDPLPLAGAAPTMLPAVQSMPRGVVNEAYVRNIGVAFGFDLMGEVLTSPDGRFMYMAGGPEDAHQLRVDVASGGFRFQNLDELWTDPERARDLQESPEEALGSALTFLRGYAKALPGGFEFNPQIQPTVELEGAAEGLGEDLRGGGLESTRAISNPTNYAVHFARSVSDPLSQEFSVVGPGSRLNVYIGEGGEVIGIKGGWRGLEVTDTMIPILSADEAWAAFEADPKIAVAQLPHADSYDRDGKPEPTLAYYEISLTQHQSNLIPVWVFVADLYVEAPLPIASADSTAAPTELVLLAEDSFIYIPAASQSSSLPDATILTPTSGLILQDGATTNLSGSASGGTPPYTFLWSSSIDGDLGEGPTLNNVALRADPRGPITPNIITLTVIDSDGLIATESVNVTVLGSLHLPFMMIE